MIAIFIIIITITIFRIYELSLKEQNLRFPSSAIWLSDIQPTSAY